MILILCGVSARELGKVEVSKVGDFLRALGAEISDHSFRYALRSGLIYVAGSIAFAGGRP